MGDHEVIDRAPNDNRNPVTFCDADACCSCGVAEGDPDCLRRKADFCLWLAVKFPRAALGAALNKLGLAAHRVAEQEITIGLGETVGAGVPLSLIRRRGIFRLHFPPRRMKAPRILCHAGK
jgi:hypothetical protein